MGETNKGCLQGVLYLVYQRKVLALSDFGGQDGTERGLHWVQEYCVDEFSQSQYWGKRRYWE